MPLAFIGHILQTKGALHSIERSAQVFYRYSFGRRMFTSMAERLDEELCARGIRVTFCVTASLLQSHREVFELLRALGHEFAAHGYFHTNMKLKGYDEQTSIIRRSIEAFERLGIRVTGFRCPYLSYNDDTLGALEASPFEWTSNNVVHWERELKAEGRALRHLKKLEYLYRTAAPEASISTPSMTGRIVDIPITAPDDEMLIERYRIRGQDEISRIWRSISAKVHERGELFHLLFHPERYALVAGPVREAVIDAARRSPAVWFATLNEITAWWRERSSAKWHLERSGGAFRLRFSGPASSTLLMKSTAPAPPGPAMSRSVRLSHDRGEFALETAEPWKHMIQLSKACCREVEDFLNGEGFATVRVEHPHRNALFIDCYSTLTGMDRRELLDVAENSNYPLLRLWRWPNGTQSAFTISSDVDSIDIADFFKRFLYF